MSAPKNIGPYRYQLLEDEPFAETRMSLLWLAHESDLQQRKQEKVVLKFARLKEEQFSLTNQRAIENEVNWLRQLHHPGIIKLRPIAQLQAARADHVIYHARGITLPGEPWFVVTDYLPGGTLQQLVEDRKRLSTPLALQIAQRLATTLAYVHSQGCVHRDFKPNNVLFFKQPDLQQLGRASQPILIDFGIANEVGEEKSMAGTRPWLAPECDRALRARTKLAADPAVDVYALGLVLYYMLTGQRPPDADPHIQSHLVLTPAMLADVPAQHQQKVAAALTWVIARTVNDDPTSRGPAQQLRDDLDEVLALCQPRKRLGEWLPGRGYWGRRHWLGSAVTAGLISLLLIFANRGAPPPRPPATPVAVAPGVIVLPPDATPTLPATATAQPAAVIETNTPTATVPPSPTAVSTATATDQPTVAQPALVATPTLAPSATLTPSPAATSTALSKTAPTSTPLPSNTPTPVPAATATATPLPTAAPKTVNTGGVTLSEPLGATLRGTYDFRWTSTVTLGENQAYEMVFWPVGQEPLANGFGPVGTNRETTVRVDLDRAAALLPRLLIPGKEYEWGVLLVQSNPYQRLRYLGGRQPFRFEGSGGDSGGSNQGGGDNSPNKPPDPEPTSTPTPRGLRQTE